MRLSALFFSFGFRFEHHAYLFCFFVFFKLHFVMFDCSATPKMGPLRHDSISEEESFVRKDICEESDQNKNETKSTSCKQSRVAYCVNLDRMTHPNKVH